MKNGSLTVCDCEGNYRRYGRTCYDTVNRNGTEDEREEENLRIIRLLYGVGIPITSIAFHYFYTAVQICTHDVLAPTNAQKNIYMVISEHYNVSHRSVERAMRAAFTEEVSLRAKNLFEKELRIFSFNQCDEVTPMEFISLVALVMSA